MLSHPLSYTPSLCRRIPMMFRTVRASLAALAVFNFASSLASPVTVSSTWHSMQKGPEPLCNSPTLHGPWSAPQCLWAGLGSRTRRPQPPLLPSLPRAKRPRSAPSVSIYPALRKPPPFAPASPLAPPRLLAIISSPPQANPLRPPSTLHPHPHLSSCLSCPPKHYSQALLPSITPKHSQALLPSITPPPPSTAAPALSPSSVPAFLLPRTLLRCASRECSGLPRFRACTLMLHQRSREKTRDRRLGYHSEQWGIMRLVSTISARVTQEAVEKSHTDLDPPHDPP